MIGAGVAHFMIPEALIRIVPARLPDPRLLVQISGVAEVAGGVGLALPFFRRAAAWGLIALYVAVFPANLNQAMNHIPAGGVPNIVLWLRLPLQIVLIAWAAWYTQPEKTA
jgi:uncharacterized membrane protein